MRSYTYEVLHLQRDFSPSIFLTSLEYSGLKQLALVAPVRFQPPLAAIFNLVVSEVSVVISFFSFKRVFARTEHLFVCLI